MTNRPCSPGSDPHADRPNWHRAETADDYLRNCDEGLEGYSDTRLAKLLGISRGEIWRWKLMAQIPEALFDRLLTNRDHTTSTKELAAVALAVSGHQPAADVERCPHCGEVLRIRRKWRTATAKIVNDWLAATPGAAP